MTNVWLGGRIVCLFCGRTKEPFLETVRGNSNSQKSSGQHKLEASNAQGGIKLFFSVSYGQECVLWHLEEQLGQLANCTLENDKPLENQKSDSNPKRNWCSFELHSCYFVLNFKHFLLNMENLLFFL